MGLVRPVCDEYDNSLPLEYQPFPPPSLPLGIPLWARGLAR
jgi:hypothetical protein